jgi:outer membrane protein OmpA-like peptidoglycan-associated protein
MDPALWELLRDSTDDQEIEAIIRLDRPEVSVAGVRIVSRFGPIATCRLRRDSILDVRWNENCISLKAARALGPEDGQHGGDTAWESSRDEGDIRRPPSLSLTGAGVTVGFVDWGCDFDHPNFKRRDGSTRLRALWDQRRPAAPGAPQPYGYGVVHNRGQINRALRTTDPYVALGYHPADADRDGSGAHGSHVMDIAAGNGLAGGPVGIAPEADLVFVQLADRGTSGLANLGDSVRILEAVDFIARTAGSRPWVINISVGRHGGPHDGCTLAELALDFLLRAAPGRFIVQSAGNYFDARTHASGRLEPGQVRSLAITTLEADVTPNELEIWYSGEDEFLVQVTSPTGQQTRWVPLREAADVVEDDQVVGRIYHRNRDPNNHDNHVELFLYPWAPAGSWSVSLRAVRIRRGIFHAWLERDEGCGECQARFVEADVDSACTLGTIACTHLPLVVGAYDAHSLSRQLAHFSSAGPTRDGRCKPDLVAPGVGVLAARSAPQGSTNSLGLLARKSGTSMAAPHVTGAVALCLEGAPGPLAAEQTRALLLGATRPLTEAGGSLSRSGCGYLDVANVVAAVSARGRDMQRSRPHRSADAERARYDPKEIEVDPQLEVAIPLSLSPDTLYRELASGRDGPVSTWVDATFDVVARPGELPSSQPEAGDILVRVALGEPGLGHVAMLSTSSLTPQNALDPAFTRSERGGPGLYATVIELRAVPHRRADRFARRVLDPAGRMPRSQLLLRPKPPPQPEPGVEPYAQEPTGEDVPMRLPAQTPASERCKAAWSQRLARLAPEVRQVLESAASQEVPDRLQRAVDFGVRDVNLLTDFAYFTIYGEERGWCPIPRGHPDADDWLALRKEVEAKLRAPSRPVTQAGPVPCVGRGENRRAAPEPDQAPDDLTGRYEYTLVGRDRPYGALAINQAGLHLEFSLAPFASPFDPHTDRRVSFYTGDLHEHDDFLAVDKDQPEQHRWYLRRRGPQLELVEIGTGELYAVARRVEPRATLFPVAIQSISRSLDRPAGAVGRLLDIAERFLTTVYVGPFLYRQEHLPLSTNQVTFLHERFASAEFTELVRQAAAAEGFRSADDSARERLLADLERFVDRTVNDRTNGVHVSDYSLARAVVRRTLSQGGFTDGRRRQSYLDWIQQLAEVADRPIAADSVLGVRSSGKPTGSYVYDIDLEVKGAAYFLGGGVGKLTVRQVAPTAWPEPLTLRVWFGLVGTSLSLADHFHGQASAPLPWSQADFVGRIERVSGSAKVEIEGTEAELSAGFLHIYGSELLPPLTVLETGRDLDLGLPSREEDRRRKLKWDLHVGLSGLVGYTRATSELKILDLTQADPEPVYAAQGGGRRDIHFCFDSALLTLAARQLVRVVSALWRPFLTSPHSTLSIVGYADKAGPEAYNLTLSQRRADNTLIAFRDVLGEAFAASPETKGMGEAEAAAGGPRAGAPDRRVEVRLDGLTVLVLHGEPG